MRSESIESVERVSFHGRTVLLATDGSPSAKSATCFTDSLAAELHARVQVVVVLDIRRAPMPAPLDTAVQLAGEAVGPGVHAEQEDAVRRGLSATLGHDVNWDVRMALGAPAEAISREARRVDAALIVMGLRHHGRIVRVLNDETTLNVIRTAPCPVLGVAPGMESLPTRIVAAMDFSVASFSAAAVARALMPSGGMLTLAYVPSLVAPPAEDGEGMIHSLGVQAGFDRARKSLDGGVKVDQVIIHHQSRAPVAELLLECAENTSASLIAAGTARPSRVDRWLLGSVSTDLIRDGRCSVLVVPPDGKRREAGSPE